jgi:hypothetical protein
MINSPKTIVAAAAAVAAFCAPVAAQAHGHGQEQRQEHGHGLGHRQLHTPKTTNVILKGTVASVDANVVTVDVTRANHHGRALAGQQVQLDLTAARVLVKDVNADGNRDAADIAAGDRVLAQLRIPRGSTPDLTQAFATRRLLDVGPKPTPATEDN